MLCCGLLSLLRMLLLGGPRKGSMCARCVFAWPLLEQRVCASTACLACLQGLSPAKMPVSRRSAQRLLRSVLRRRKLSARECPSNLQRPSGHTRAWGRACDLQIY